ncbi:MAG: hypothetical protein AB1831_07205 [Pseudomonadota bacterium]
MNLPGIAMLLASLLVTGCASMPETQMARRVDPGQAPALRTGEVLIYGRILFIENGASKAPYGLGKPLWSVITRQPVVAPQADGAGPQPPRRRNIPFLSTRKDGVFAYAIPAGHYEMGGLVPFYYTPFIEPALEFDASEAGRAYCLGDLEVDYDASSWLGGLWGNYITHLNHVEVIDRCDGLAGQVLVDATAAPPAKKALLSRIYGRIPGFSGQFVPPPIHR